MRSLGPPSTRVLALWICTLLAVSLPVVVSAPAEDHLTGVMPATSTTTSSAVEAAPPAPTSTSAAPAPTTVVAPTGRPASGETREAWQWPFDAGSPWNSGVGAAARYEDAGAPRTATLIRDDIDAWVNAEQYSHPVYRASASDPLATVRSRNGQPDVQYRIPDGARPAAGSDKNLHVVDPTGRWVDESWWTEGRNPSWTSGFHLTVDLWGGGFGHGVRASGASALGGLIRQWDIDQGAIRHALALAITGGQLRRGPVWPANREDGDAAGSYRGAVPMGTFAAIPRSVDVGRLGLSPVGVMLAKAMQDYGVFVVDRSGVTTLYAEPTLDRGHLGELRKAFDTLRGHLRAVTDNRGGATVAPAPPFA
jgi:hypothetical protein